MENRSTDAAGMSDVVLGCVIPYIHDSSDRDAVSLVCRRWWELDALTRKHVTIDLCYTTSPDRLGNRFNHLESLKLKGTPDPPMYCPIPEDWGGHVTKWVSEIAESFNCLKSLHCRKLIVKDSDLELLARAKGGVLQALKLNSCEGFSTDGLLHIGRYCRSLRTLVLEESSIMEKDGEWLHQLALNNNVLETLNFYMTFLHKVNIKDLELIARNCHSLVSVKITYQYEILDLVGFFRTAAVLEKFCGGSFSEQPDKYSTVSFPPRLSSLGIPGMGKKDMAIVYPPMLKTLDLISAVLDTESHCMLIQRCPNLEVLKMWNRIGDRGLKVLAQCCKRLKKLKIAHQAAELGAEDYKVSQRGLIALAQGCVELEYMAVSVSDITNASLEYIGTYLKNLCFFRLVLVGREERITDLPLDNGVRALLRGCKKLRRFDLYLKPGALTDVGLGYIGQCSQNVRRMVLGCVGESDAGLLELSTGCPMLQKLEMKDCSFSEHALGVAMMQLTSLRFLFVQGYIASATDIDLQAMVSPFWNIKLIPYTDEDENESPPDVLAYSLAR